MDPRWPSSDNAAQNEEFVRLFGLNQGRVFVYIATLLPSWADADEVLQRTSLVLWRKFDQFDPSGSFVRWAYGVAYRQAIANSKRKTWKTAQAVLGKTKSSVEHRTLVPRLQSRNSSSLPTLNPICHPHPPPPSLQPPSTAPSAISPRAGRYRT